jgi:hypothetical protein
MVTDDVSLQSLSTSRLKLEVFQPIKTNILSNDRLINYLNEGYFLNSLLSQHFIPNKLVATSNDIYVPPRIFICSIILRYTSSCFYTFEAQKYVY